MFRHFQWRNICCIVNHSVNYHQQRSICDLDNHIRIFSKYWTFCETLTRCMQCVQTKTWNGRGYISYWPKHVQCRAEDLMIWDRDMAVEHGLIFQRRKTLEVRRGVSTNLGSVSTAVRIAESVTPRHGSVPVRPLFDLRIFHYPHEVRNLLLYTICSSLSQILEAVPCSLASLLQARSARRFWAGVSGKEVAAARS